MKKSQTQVVVGFLRNKADGNTLRLINDQLGRGRYLSQIWSDIRRSKTPENQARVNALMQLTGVKNTSDNRKWKRVEKRLLKAAGQ